MVDNRRDGLESGLIALEQCGRHDSLGQQALQLPAVPLSRFARVESCPQLLWQELVRYAQLKPVRAFFDDGSHDPRILCPTGGLMVDLNRRTGTQG